MTRFFSLLIVLLGCQTLLDAAERPNIVFILADDMGCSTTA